MTNTPCPSHTPMPPPVFFKILLRLAFPQPLTVSRERVLAGPQVTSRSVADNVITPPPGPCAHPPSSWAPVDHGSHLLQPRFWLKAEISFFHPKIKITSPSFIKVHFFFFPIESPTLLNKGIQGELREWLLATKMSKFCFL